MSLMRAVLLSAFALAACARAPGSDKATPPTPEPVVAAERAFAQDGYDLGFKVSFLKWSADDAIVFQPGPVNAHETISKAPDLELSAPRQHLIWWPLWAGIAKSGDLGFTTGPAAIDDKRFGHYFTVWKKQADGSWKWVIDAGVGADPANEAAQGADVSFLAIATVGSPSPQAALEAVKEAEAALAAAAATDQAAAINAHLAADGRVHSEGPPPAKSSADHAAALGARAKAMTFSGLGGGASEAGDLVWTYGEAHWTTDGADTLGYYIRVWQKRADGWKIVFDEVFPRRG